MVRKGLLIGYLIYIVLLSFITFSVSPNTNARSLSVSLGLKSAQSVILYETPRFMQEGTIKHYGTEYQPNITSFIVFILVGSVILGILYKVFPEESLVTELENTETKESQDEFTKKLSKLDELKIEGILTQEEYDYKRKDLIKKFDV